MTQYERCDDRVGAIIYLEWLGWIAMAWLRARLDLAGRSSSREETQNGLSVQVPSENELGQVRVRFN